MHVILEIQYKGKYHVCVPSHCVLYVRSWCVCLTL